MAMLICWEKKTTIFHLNFFNMNIYSNISPTTLKSLQLIIHVLWEGIVSQIFYMGLSFYSSFIEKCDLNNYKNFPIFCNKIKTRISVENLRQNVLHVCNEGFLWILLLLSKY